MDEQVKGQADLLMNTAKSSRLCVSLRQWNAIEAIDVCNNNKKKSIYDQCPNPLYFNTQLLNI